MLGARRRLSLLAISVLLAAATCADAGVTSEYRRKLEATVGMPLDADVFRVPPGYNAPQQVHITLGDQTGTAMLLSWVTANELGNSTVMYGYAPDKLELRAEATHTRYDYFNYTSGFIHHCTLKNLKGETTPFKPFTHRYPTPFRAAGSTEPFWYSVKMASAHIVVLASYSSYGKYTPQWMWLQEELATRVDRKETPWLIVLMHSPWYNSNNYHYMEGETMRVQFEKWLVDAKVDLVLAGHVHSYERSRRFSNVEYNIVNGKSTPTHNMDAPIYVNIGDGGNIEGVAKNFTQPQPSYSAFREASFGHATLEIKNRTHAYYVWHRNHDGAKAVADSMWFTNRYWMPTDDSN